MGGYAEYTAVPVSTTYKVPSDVKSGVAAAAAIQGLTALILTHEVYSVQKGDWVLVHAAAGGVGLWLCQVLKALGANTVGTASTAEKIKLAKENGAGWMINYKETDLVQKVMEITNGKGVKVVYDSVGKEQAENNLEVLAKNGILINYGASVS
jgi:NADPH2:quinone reductase